VSFEDGGTVIGYSTLNGGVATLLRISYSGSAHAFGNYHGDSNF